MASFASILVAIISFMLVAAHAQSATPWQAGTAYKPGDLALYNGATFKCLQAHTAQNGWEPSAAAALWASQGSNADKPAPTSAATGAPSIPVGAGCWPAWTAGSAYAGGAQVSYASKNYRAGWWTQGNVPASNSGVGQPWVLVASCGASPSTTPTTVPATPRPTTKAPTAAPSTAPTAPATTIPSSGNGCWPAWSESGTYIGGSRVSHVGKNYRAGWWTRGDIPAANSGAGQPWVLDGACGGSDSSTSGAPTAAPTAAATSAPATPRPTTKAPTAAPSTSKPSNNTSLPKRVLMGYWHNFINGATCLRLSNVPAAYNVIAVSFADSEATPGTVSFNVDSGLSACLGGYTNDQFISDMRVAHSKGQKVVISIGGQLGLLTVNSESTATAFANSVFSLMQRFDFDGVDIDLENGIDPVYMSNALHKLAARAPGVIITLAPQTLDMQNTQMTYFKLALLIKDILSVSNTQYYNSGTMLGCDGKVYAQGGVDFLTALACTQLQGGLDADQLGLGLPSSINGAGSGYVSPSIVANALRCITTGRDCGSFKMSTTYPSFRGAMTWSINWDASNGYQFANIVGAALAALP